MIFLSTLDANSSQTDVNSAISKKKGVGFGRIRVVQGARRPFDHSPSQKVPDVRGISAIRCGRCLGTHVSWRILCDSHNPRGFRIGHYTFKTPQHEFIRRTGVPPMNHNNQKKPPGFERYLKSSAVIDFDDPDVARKARVLAGGCTTDAEIAERCFLFVRDEILHSWDHRKNPVTLSASEVLRYGTGYCYAKSHLLAALLRSNGVPAGLCYQRLVCNEFGQPFFIHGLNAIWLEGSGWYRADARGLKPGYDAAFTPPVEALPYMVRFPGEADLPEVWDEPLPAIVGALTRYADYEEVRRNLPDIDVVNLAGKKDLFRS